MQPDIIGILILCICVFLFVTKLLPSSVVGCLGCIAMVLCGVADFEVAFSGFSNSIVLLMAGSMIVGIAMFKTGTAQIIGRFIIKCAHGSERKFLISSCLVAGILAMFLANTAVLAAFIPIIDSVSKTSNEIKERNVILPLAYAVMFGGSCTLIGCTPQLTANGLMQKMVGIEMGMWDLTGPALCLFIMFILYIAFYGYKDGDKIWGHRDSVDMQISQEKIKSVLKPEYSKRKVTIMLTILTFMMISYTFSILTVAETAVCAALLCVVFDCCNVHDISKDLSWETIVFLATCLGLADALTASKSAELIGSVVSNLLGNINSPYVIFAILVLLTLVISQFITNSTAIIIVLPIALSICDLYGFSPMSFCMGITLAASLACLTPLAAAQITMTEIAEYEFTDYFRYGIKLTCLSYVGILVFVPLFYPLI